MVNICFKQYMIWRWQQCVHIHNLIMCYYIGAQFPRIDLPSPESDQHNSNVMQTTCFHVYQHISRCIVHGRRPFNENKQCQQCVASIDSIINAKLYTIKELVVMETSIQDSRQKFYMHVIQKLLLHLLYVHIIGACQCENTHRKVFTRR